MQIYQQNKAVVIVCNSTIRIIIVDNAEQNIIMVDMILRVYLFFKNRIIPNSKFSGEHHNML